MPAMVSHGLHPAKAMGAPLDPSRVTDTPDPSSILRLFPYSGSKAGFSCYFMGSAFSVSFARGLSSHPLKMGVSSCLRCGSWGCKESDTTERLNWTEHSLLRWVKSHGSHGLNDINTLRVPNIISAVNILDVSGPKLESPRLLCLISHVRSSNWFGSLGSTFGTSQHLHWFPPTPSHHGTWWAQQLPNLSFCCYYPIFFSAPIHTQQPRFLKKPLS